jgi:hypothetical protein
MGARGLFRGEKRKRTFPVLPEMELTNGRESAARSKPCLLSGAAGWSRQQHSGKLGSRAVTPRSLKRA